MRYRHFAVIVAVPAVLLGGCDATYRDISSDPTHKPLIGKVCEVVADLRAHGVTRTLEREKKTDYVSIWNPGFTGPEMTFLVILPPSTRLQVLGAREWSNCPFDRMLEYQVKVNPEPRLFGGKPAYIRADSMSAPHVRCPDGKAP